MKVSTIKIVGENGPLIINESDFNKDKHKIWSDKPAKKQSDKPAKKQSKKKAKKAD